jgi:hypothetical protein
MNQQYKYLWFLMLSYVMVLAFANWFDPRLVNIFGLNTDAGTLIFPLSFILSDLITEVYGYKYARKAIWTGFLFNAIFIGYGQIVIHLPSPSYQTHNEIFNTLLASDLRIIIASAISYFIAEPLNSIIMAKLKIKMRGRNMSVRFVASTFIASFFDSFIFSTLAFYNVMSNSNLLALIITMWLIKVAIEFFGLPFSVYLAKKLKNLERMDIYDYQTKFTLFSLSTNYQANENYF